MKEIKDWKDQLRAAKQERDRQDDRDNLAKTKKQSRLMYQKRKLDKDVKKYTNKHNRINSRDIDAIGRSHGFYIEGTLLGKDCASQEDA